MENLLFGVVVQVSDLDRCRTFYRDVLGLGAPVMDSTFRVEFRLDAQTSLFLEKSEVLDPPCGGHVSWVYRPRDPDGVIRALTDAGCRMTAGDLAGFEVCRFRDPEGNPFFIFSEAKGKKI